MIFREIFSNHEFKMNLGRGILKKTFAFVLFEMRLMANVTDQWRIQDFQIEGEGGGI